MRAALYARFSSDNQRYESITAQLRASTAYCAAKGYTIVKTYTDEAQSGTTVAGREGFQQMILESADDIFDVVIFHKIDRAARNEIDYYANMSRLDKNGIAYEFSGEGIDTTTANGKLMEGMKVAMAAWFSRNLSSEIKKGKKETAIQLKHNGGTPPFGYDVGGDGHYIINEEEAVAVRHIFEMKANGEGYGAITEWLNGHGYTTKRGGKFGKNSLHDILVNKKYIGVYQYGRTTKHNSHVESPDMMEVENALPKIIDDDMFFKVASIINAKRNGKNSATIDYLLTGKLVCQCGSVMYGAKNGVRKSTGHHYYHYLCREKYYKGSHCTTPRLRKEYLETVIFNLIIEELQLKKDNIIDEFVKLSQDDSALKKKKALAKQIATQEQKIERLIDMYTNTGDKSLLGRYTEAKDILAVIKKEYAAIQTDNSVDISEVANFIDALKYIEFEPQDMKKIFDLFIKKVTVYDDHLDIEMNIKNHNFVVALRRTYPLYDWQTRKSYLKSLPQPLLRKLGSITKNLW